MNAPRNWSLIAPDWGAVDTVWKNPLPFILWPICGKPLLAYWLDEALHAGAQHVVVVAADRPHLVRVWLEKGNYWSKEIEVCSREEARESFEVHRMDRLPAMPEMPVVADGKDLIERWVVLHGAALSQREAANLTIDRQIAPGVWVGPGAVIHPDAVLEEPCWVGPRARVGKGCRIGPRAFVGREAILDEDVEVRDSVVCNESFVGRHTSLNHNVVQGGVLLNWELGVNLKIAEDFILCDLSRRSRRTPLGERMLAAFLFAGLIVPAAFRNGFRSPHRQVVRLGDGEEMELRTWSKGPLMLRRVFWFLAVLRGRFRILGVLPRGANDWDALTPELHALLAGTPAGVFALSDLHDCHDAAQPDESLHAAYQAGAAENFGLRQLKRAIFAVALKSPLP